MYKLKNHKLDLMTNLKGKDQPLVFIVQDGDMFHEEENNIAGKLLETMTDIILVGVHPQNRFEEYTPWPEDEFRPDFPFLGGGNDYLDFIVQDLIPFLESELDLKLKSENIFLAGASLGGLISAYGLFKYPHNFGGGILVSSSFWYDNFLDFIEGETGNPDQIIYMDLGDREGVGLVTKNKDVLPLTKDFYRLLIEKGYKEDYLKFIVHENMTHRITYFIDRIYDGINFIYRKKRNS